MGWWNVKICESDLKIASFRRRSYEPIEIGNTQVVMNVGFPRKMGGKTKGFLNGRPPLGTFERLQIDDGNWMPQINFKMPHPRPTLRFAHIMRLSNVTTVICIKPRF